MTCHLRGELIAEPWDVGPGGYQIGNFPHGWTEWNGKYRDLVRRFWKGDGGLASEFATRLSGSPDLYERSGRKPYASINFVTCHDGFCLQDLVSYDHKHNEANREDNRDGADDNASWNCGAEGPTDDPAIISLRERQKRNLLATLLLSQGVPMLLAGDELGHSQNGNNNAYCQDNELSWNSWSINPTQAAFLTFVKKVILLWKSQPVFQRRNFFHGRTIRGTNAAAISWLDPNGEEMTDEAWNTHFVKCFAMRLAGDIIGEVDERGQPVTGDTLLVMLNAHWESIPFRLPHCSEGQSWELVFDTAQPDPEIRVLTSNEPYPLQDRSLAVARIRAPEDETKSGLTTTQIDVLRRGIIPRPASVATDPNERQRP